MSSSISTAQFSQLSDALTEVNKDVKGINSKVALIEKSMQEASMVDKLRMQVTRLTAERDSMQREISSLEGANTSLSVDRDKWQGMTEKMLLAMSGESPAPQTKKKKKKSSKSSSEE